MCGSLGTGNATVYSKCTGVGAMDLRNIFLEYFVDVMAKLNAEQPHHIAF